MFLEEEVKKKREMARSDSGFSDEGIKRASLTSVKEAAKSIAEVKKEISKAFFGQLQTVDSLMRALLCNGHVLLEGVPGIGKTLLIRTLAQVSGCSFKRIQFTADLLPTDILGITTYDPQKGFEISKGPIFAHFIIADEINRSPPKCVLADTPIVMRNGEILDIKTIVDNYASEESYCENNECWFKPKNQLELLSFDYTTGKIKPQEVKYLYKQKTSAPFNDILLKSGRKIKTSPVHPFFTLREGKIETISAGELMESDCVLIPRMLSVEGDNHLEYKKEFLDKSEKIIEEIKRRKQLYSNFLDLKKKGLTFSQIKIGLDINDKKNENLLKSFMLSEPLYLNYSGDLFYSESKQFGKVSCIRQPKEITTEFAHFMAIMIAEGNINKSYFYISMKDRKILEYFIKITENLFGLKVKLLFDKKRGIYRVAFRSNALVDLLRALGYEPHCLAGEKSIPRFILKAKDEIIREFLRVYYDCDGCISRDCVKVTTKSEKIANTLSYLLLRLGFVAKIGRDFSETKIGEYSYKGYFYNLRLYGGDLYNFSKKIDFFSLEKSVKLHNLVKNIRGIKTDLMPQMHSLIKYLRKSNGISHKNFYERTGMHAHNLENPNNALMISRSRLSEISRAFEEDNLLSKLIGGDFYCDFVRENKIIKPKKEYWLYDFSMKDTHSFIAGFGGIISHNTQSSLIEAMQEGQVTIGKVTFPLPRPFFVMANQNPVETEGVYSLPEAQIDRFLFKILMDYPDEVNEEKIMSENITFKKFEEYGLRQMLSPQKIMELQQLTQSIYLDKKIKKYIVEIVKRSRTREFPQGEYVELGGSPRASISLFIAAKAEALLNGRNYAIPKDIKAVIKDVLRHRFILSYRAKSDGITSEKLIDEILKLVKAP